LDARAGGLTIILVPRAPLSGCPAILPFNKRAQAMGTPGSVTGWLAQLQAGEDEAAQPLWERYFRQLVELARSRLRGVPRASADEEDVALSAFDSFCRGAVEGRFPQLHDRDELWRLLVVITAHKALDRLRHERRQKRCGTSIEANGLKGMIGPEPSPAFAAQVAEECRRLLRGLQDPELEVVAVWKMEGYTAAEIAEKLGYVTRTVERKLRLIRSIWAQEVP
jgi:DNA-directed RNA polymerase specialized sigma24 family protein